MSDLPRCSFIFGETCGHPVQEPLDPCVSGFVSVPEGVRPTATNSLRFPGGSTQFKLSISVTDCMLDPVQQDVEIELVGGIYCIVHTDIMNFQFVAMADIRCEPHEPVLEEIPKHAKSIAKRRR